MHHDTVVFIYIYIYIKETINRITVTENKSLSIKTRLHYCDRPILPWSAVYDVFDIQYFCLVNETVVILFGVKS